MEDEFKVMDERIQKIREAFLPFRGKRIIIYGSGIIANRVLEALYDFQIVGILDRLKLEGYIKNTPILSWEDVGVDFADILIIASKSDFYQEIYDRIIYSCIYRQIRIFDIQGQTLAERYQLEITDMNIARYYLKNKEELKRRVDEYEAISFDLFDTLIMRRTLEPIDVFDFVECRLREKGIIISDFKKKRRTAELESRGKDIYGIYEMLSQMLQLDEKKTQEILAEEIQCEKEYMISRRDVAEVLEYAVSQGKTVSIISDMYLTSEILADILHSVGIDQYHKIYVSCEYGKGKGNGLFEDYIKDVEGKKCLHIGDNWQSDIIAARKYGIDAYEIKNAYDMLKISNFRKILVYTNSKCDRFFVGNIIAELFNSPFALYMSVGSIVHMKNLRMVARTFVVPAVVHYMQELYDLLKRQTYQGVLFGARDGYLFKKLYDSDIFELVENKPESIYFYTSRKLAVKASVRMRGDIDEFITYLGSKINVKNILMQMFNTEGSPLETELYIDDNFETMKEHAEITRNHYMQYMVENDIDLNGKYLFCDLISSGTVHSALNKIFYTELEAIYLHRGVRSVKKDLLVNYVYNNQHQFLNKNIIYFFEKILTSPEPTIVDMEEGGKPVFGSEDRDNNEVELLEYIQDIICQEVREYIGFQKWDKKVSKDLTCMLLELVNHTMFDDEAAILTEMKLMDDMNMSRVKVFAREE